MTGHFAMTGMTISSLWDQTEKGVESLRVRNLDFTSAVAAVCAMGVRRWGGARTSSRKRKQLSLVWRRGVVVWVSHVYVKS